MPIGGGKGGADFNPKGRSDAEVMRFCQSFMTELSKHIGPDTDVPAGDIGVGGREIGYLFGQYKRLSNEFTGALTGKGLAYGGSLARTEATGYGLCYFADNMFQSAGRSFEGATVVVSGSGNVAIYACEKATDFGAKVVAMSDSGGYVCDPDGIDLALVKDLKEVRRARISAYVDSYPRAEYHAGCAGIWQIPCDIALPCATQNEIAVEGAVRILVNRVGYYVEAANMPATPDTLRLLRLSPDILVAGAKASGAGGVAVSALEMVQNSLRYSWPRKQVEERLRQIMADIHDVSAAAAEAYGLGYGPDRRQRHRLLPEGLPGHDGPGTVIIKGAPGPGGPGAPCAVHVGKITICRFGSLCILGKMQTCGCGRNVV